MARRDGVWSYEALLAVISGAHWQSDVDVTHLAASIGYSRLQTSAAFRAQMELAKDEFRVLGDCRSGRQ